MTTPHVLLTRFNVPANGVEQSLYSEEWLRERLDLFLRYTVPSVEAQTTRPAGWILFCDVASPTWMWERLESLLRSGAARVHTLDGPLGEEELEDLVQDCVGPDVHRVLTSNLDNDDAIARDFVERAGQAVTGGYEGVVFDEGLVLKGGDLYHVKDHNNPFTVVSSDIGRGQLRTCWVDWHNRLDRHFRLRHVPEVAWLQVVHGRNVSNTVRGTLVAPSLYQSAMPWALADLAAPSSSSLWCERWLVGPARIMRGRARHAVAGWSRGVLGAERFDDLKARLMGGAGR